MHKRVLTHKMLSFQTHKKGGFGIVFPMILGLFLLVSLFYASFFMFQYQIDTQLDFLESSQNSQLATSSQSFNVSGPYEMSGKTFLSLQNLEDKPLVFKDSNDAFCFDIFYKNTFFDQDEKYVFSSNPLSLTSYSQIDSRSEGSLIVDQTSLFNSPLSISSCSRVSKEFTFNSSNKEYWDTSWKLRERVNVTGSSFSDVYEYQVFSSFNQSTIDFNELQKNDVRVTMPLNQYLELDLPFDQYSQSLNDFSRNGYSSTLGSGVGVESQDPNEVSGVLFSALDFNSSTFVTTSNFDDFLGSQELTVSMWIKNTSDVTSSSLLYHQNLINVSVSNQNNLSVSFKGTSWSTPEEFSFDFSNGYSLLSITYTSGRVCVYQNTQLIRCASITPSELDGASSTLYVGKHPSFSGFSGVIDEVKFFSIGLNSQEISNLAYGQPLFRELDFFISKLDYQEEIFEVYSQIPKIKQNENYVFDVYYDNENSIEEMSNLTAAFSYSTPREVGYIVSSQLADSTGISIMSLEDNNSIEIGTNTLTLDKQTSSTLGTAQIIINDSVKATKHLQVEGSGEGSEMIVPLSWASTEFSYTGFRAGTDRFCIVAPFGDASVDFRYVSGTLQTDSHTVTSSGLCLDKSVDTASNLYISSDVPILVSYYGVGGSDSQVFYPLYNSTLYGVPSQNLYLSAGPLGATGTIQESDGTFQPFTLGAYGTQNIGGFGGDGSANALEIISNDFIAASQQADNDGTEMSVFAPTKEFSTVFGSSQQADYIAVVSNHPQANCRIYDSTNSLVGSQLSGVGGNSIFKYDFGTGNDNNLVGANWKIECDHPVWPYYEKSVQGDETQLFGPLQMRQYVWPEPQVVIQ